MFPNNKQSMVHFNKHDEHMKFRPPSSSIYSFKFKLQLAADSQLDTYCASESSTELIFETEDSPANWLGLDLNESPSAWTFNMCILTDGLHVHGYVDHKYGTFYSPNKVNII